jgi:hypothetical protein
VTVRERNKIHLRQSHRQRRPYWAKTYMPCRVNNARGHWYGNKIVDDCPKLYHGDQMRFEYVTEQLKATDKIEFDPIEDFAGNIRQSEECIQIR